MSLQPDGRVELAGAELFEQHPLSVASHRWAHVHETPGGTFSRIISPRELHPGVEYVVALVPAWRPQTQADGTLTLVDSWADGTPSVTLPCFDSWGFRTTVDPGDFASISRRLEPLSDEDAAMLAAKQFGRARVEVGPLPGTVLSAGAALTVVPDPGDPPVVDPLPQPVADAVEPLCKDLDDGGRWVLTLPRYDVPWYPGPIDGQSWAWPPPGDDVVPDGWRRQLRADPRDRGAAGLGAWIAIAWQDRISDGAAAQAGAVAAAAQRIRHLVIGLRAAGSLWQRRVPTEPVARLATLSPLLGRMPVDGGGSALQALTGRTPALAPALVSSAARRMLRRRGALDRSAAPGATSLAALLEAANRCPEPQKLSDADARLSDLLSNPDRRQQLAADVRERAAAVLSEIDDEHTASLLIRLLETDGAAEGVVDIAHEDPPELDCTPLDLGAFASSVAAGVDPTVARPVVVDRVLGGLGGLREPLLAEPDVAPELDIPLWRFLADNVPDWLLPGGGDIPPDRVLAVQSNPAFVDAVLIGANEQTLGELRWRNLPITIPLDAAAPVLAAHQRRRGRGRHGHPLGGRARHRPAALARQHGTRRRQPPLRPDARRHLVVVLHTELFRRYPSTIVYLTPQPRRRRIWGDGRRTSTTRGAGARVPAFSGTLTPELVFFGFGVPPAAGRDHWLVLEEPPPGYRFRHPAGRAAADGAVFAERDVRAADPRLPGEPAMTARRDEARDRARRPARRAGAGSAGRRRARGDPRVAARRRPERLADAGAATSQAQGASSSRSSTHPPRDRLALRRRARRARRRPPAAIDLFLEWTSWLESSTGRTDRCSTNSCPTRAGSSSSAPQPAMTQATAQRMSTRSRQRRPRRRRRPFMPPPAWPTTTCGTSTTPPWSGSIRSPPAKRSACCCRCGWRRATAGRSGEPWRCACASTPTRSRSRRRAAPPTKREAELVAACWTQAAGDLTTDAGEAAFRSLAASVGRPRGPPTCCAPCRSCLTAPASWPAGTTASEDSAPTPTARRSRRSLSSGATGRRARAARRAPSRPGGDRRTGGPHRRAWPASSPTGCQALVDLVRDGTEVGLAVEVEIPDGPDGPPGDEGPQLAVLLVTGLSEQDPTRAVRAACRTRLAGRRRPDEPEQHGRRRSPRQTSGGIRPPGWRSRRANGGGTSDGPGGPADGLAAPRGRSGRRPGPARRGPAARDRRCGRSSGSAG